MTLDTYAVAKHCDWQGSLMHRQRVVRNGSIIKFAHRRSRQQGFTLLEVLVALIIFSIAFGAIASIFQTSLRQTTSAEALLAATAVAERRIARYGADLPFELGETTGLSSEGLSWNAKIALAGPLRENTEFALYRISVAVGSESSEKPYLTLETLRIGKAP